MFIVRTDPATIPDLDVRLTRHTPPIVPDSQGKIDHFCVGDPDAARSAGWTVILLHDGWYADDHGGGVAIWGQGLYWEIRDTPFTVKQAAGPAATSSTHADRSLVDVRRAVFGA